MAIRERKNTGAEPFILGSVFLTILCKKRLSIIRNISITGFSQPANKVCCLVVAVCLVLEVWSQLGAGGCDPSGVGGGVVAPGELGRHYPPPPPTGPQKLAVRIILECFLVYFLNANCWVSIKKKEKMQLFSLKKLPNGGGKCVTVLFVHSYELSCRQNINAHGVYHLLNGD